MTNLEDQSYHDDLWVRIYYNGIIEWVQGLRWTTECTLDLLYFSYDTQVNYMISILNFLYFSVAWMLNIK